MKRLKPNVLLNLLLLPILWCTAFSSLAQVTPIPANKLFANAYMSRVAFAPNGQYISAFINNKIQRKLVLINTQTKQRSDIYLLSHNESINEYHWLNDNSLYLELNLKSITTRLIIDISKAINSTAKATKQPLNESYQYIQKRGYLVDVLPEQPNKVMFAHQNKRGTSVRKLMIIDIKDLVKGQFDQARVIKNIPKEALLYTYDRDAEQLFMMLTNDDKKEILLKHRKLNDKNWQLFYRIELTKATFDFKPVAFLPNNKLAVLSNKNTDKVSLYEFDLTTQKLGQVLYEHHLYDLTKATLQIGEQDEIEVTSVSYYQYGKLTTDYFSEYHAAISGQLEQAFGTNQLMLVDANVTTNQVIIRTYASDDPGKYYLYNPKNDEIELLSAVYPDLTDYSISKTQTFSVKVEPNVNIEAFLTLPNDVEHPVLLVMPHGGPIGIREYNYFDAGVQYYASRGYAVLRVNFRGSSGFGKRFQKSGVGQFGQLIEKDISAAVKVARQKVNFYKMCAIGSSYGGYSAMMLAIQNPDQYDCVISGFGIYDLPLLFNASNYKIGQVYRQSVANTVGEYNENLSQISPVYLASQVKAPVLLIAGRSDKISGFEQSHRMFYMLSRLNKPVETLFYLDTGHGHKYWKEHHHEHAYIDDYLRRTLKLPDLKSTNLTEKDRESLAYEAITIADGYNFKNKVTNDPKLALAFYQRAAQLGEPRGMYNYARHLENGTIEGTKDINKALQWYRKSAEADYASASFWLGYKYDNGIDVTQSWDEALLWYQKASENGMAKASFLLGDWYRKGDKVSQDWEKSYHAYQLANEQGHEYTARLRMASALCLGKGVKQDVKQCISWLRMNNQDKLSNENKDNDINEAGYVLRNSLFSQMMLGDTLGSDHKALMLDAIKAEYWVEVFDLEVEMQDCSLKKPTETDQVLVIREELAFGVCFDVKPAKFFGFNDKRKMVLARWRRTTEDGQEQIKQNLVLWGNRYTRQWSIRYALKEKELTPATWTVEVFDLNQKPLFSKRFSLIEK